MATQIKYVQTTICLSANYVYVNTLLLTVCVLLYLQHTHTLACSSLLTQIADTLSTMQHQQPLPFPPLPPSSVTNSLPTLPPLPSLPSFPTLHNFDASALLNSLTSQGVSLAPCP